MWTFGPNRHTRATEALRMIAEHSVVTWICNSYKKHINSESSGKVGMIYLPTYL